MGVHEVSTKLGYSPAFGKRVFIRTILKADSVLVCTCPYRAEPNNLKRIEVE
jgi:hypothetical protein